MHNEFFITRQTDEGMSLRYKYCELKESKTQQQIGENFDLRSNGSNKIFWWKFHEVQILVEKKKIHLTLLARLESTTRNLSRRTNVRRNIPQTSSRRRRMRNEMRRMKNLQRKTGDMPQPEDGRHKNKLSTMLDSLRLPQEAVESLAYDSWTEVVSLILIEIISIHTAQLSSRHEWKILLFWEFCNFAACLLLPAGISSFATTAGVHGLMKIYLTTSLSAAVFVRAFISHESRCKHFFYCLQPLNYG